MTATPRGLVTFAALLLAAGTGARAAQAGSSSAIAVSLVEPADRSFVAENTSIEATIDAPEGVTVARVDFEVDGRVIASLTAPPWRVVNDFGPDYEAHLIRVIAYDTEGRSTAAEVTTRAIVVQDTASVELVNVFATVQDRRGRYVMDLEARDFLLLEDGRPQEITYFSRNRLPLSVAMVLDVSLSMEGRQLQEAQEAAVRFIDTLEPEDNVGVVAFSDRVELIHPLDGDHEAAARAVRGLSASGGTALYDAVARTSRLLAKIDDTSRRRAIVLLSDGRDEAASGLTPGSLLNFEEALAEAIQANVILYAIGLGKSLDERLDFYGRLSLEEVLSTLARDTGGRAFATARAERLKKAYDDIEDELRHHYSLAYSPRITRRDGSWHDIEVRVREPGLEVNARRGYYAPLAASSF